MSRFPHHVTVCINEHVGPIDRGERYEDPLTDALGDRGEVSGGGSLLGRPGEIEYADVELDLADLGEALEICRRVLLGARVPKGSSIALPDGTSEPIGELETLSVYLDGVGLPDAVYASLDFPAFYATLDDRARAAGGEARGVWTGNTETAVHLLAVDADALLRAVEALWADQPILQNARLVLRRTLDERLERKRLPFA